MDPNGLFTSVISLTNTIVFMNRNSLQMGYIPIDANAVFPNAKGKITIIHLLQ